MNTQIRRAARLVLRSLPVATLIVFASGCESLEKASSAMDTTLNKIQATTDKATNMANDAQGRIDRTEASIEEASQSFEEVTEIDD